jgi:hypothetical protein
MAPLPVLLFATKMPAASAPLSTGALYGRSQRVMIPDAVKKQF